MADRRLRTNASTPKKNGKKYIHQTSARLKKSIATRPIPLPHNRQYIPAPRQKTMDILRTTSQRIQFRHNHLLDRTKPDRLAKRRTNSIRSPRQTRRNIFLPTTHGSIRRPRIRPSEFSNDVLRGTISGT